jgi:hypothetical protein
VSRIGSDEQVEKRSSMARQPCQTTKLRMSGAVQTTQRYVRYAQEQLSHLDWITDDRGSVLQRWLAVPNVQQPARDLDPDVSAGNRRGRS